MKNAWQGIIVALVLFLIASSCTGDNPPKPENLIKESTYIDLLIELQLIRSYGENARVDSITIDSLTKQVFVKYGVSGKTFRESHTYYQKFPQEQKLRIEKAIERLKMDQVTNSDTTKDTTSVAQ